MLPAQSRFGEWETTFFLIDRAVKSLKQEVEDLGKSVKGQITSEVQKLAGALAAAGSSQSVEAQGGADSASGDGERVRYAA